MPRTPSSRTRGAEADAAVGDRSGADEAGLSLRYYTVTSRDGTRLQAWTNDAEGPNVLLCNGLGTNPYTWPALLDPDCGVHVISWNHRGVGESERPADYRQVGIDAHVDDALAVLDDADVDACVVAGWSFGVNIEFQLAVDHPERVTGLFAAGGVPGATFYSVGAPLFLPRLVRRPLTRVVARILGAASPVLTPIATHLPINDQGAWLLAHSGFMLPGADPIVVRRAVTTYLQTPIDWGMHLALVADEHRRVSLSGITVPTTFVAGRHDVLASAQDMGTAAARMVDAEYHVLRGSHFIVMEHPAAVHQQLLALIDRVVVNT